MRNLDEIDKAGRMQEVWDLGWHRQAQTGTDEIFYPRLSPDTHTLIIFQAVTDTGVSSLRG